MLQNEKGSERTGALKPPPIIIPPKRHNDNSGRRTCLSPAVRRAVKASSTRNRHRNTPSERLFDNESKRLNHASSSIKSMGHANHRATATTKLRQQYIEKVYDDVKGVLDDDTEATKEAASARIWERLRSMKGTQESKLRQQLAGTLQSPPCHDNEQRHHHTGDESDNEASISSRYHHDNRDQILQPADDSSSEGEELLGELPCDSEFLDASQEQEFHTTYTKHSAPVDRALPPIAHSTLTGSIERLKKRPITAPSAFKAGMDPALLGMVKQSERSDNLRKYNTDARSSRRGARWLPKRKKKYKGKLLLRRLITSPSL